MPHEQISEDLLTIEEIRNRSSTGKRLANYVIDLIVFYILIIVFGILLAVVAPTTSELFFEESPGFGLLDRIITLMLYAIYMAVVETIFKGKSVGKFVTKTRAINIDGSKITTSTAFARGFSRAVPFSVLSALGSPSNPWHDKWTNTMVVDDRSEF